MKHLLVDLYCVYSTFIIYIFYQISLTSAAHGYFSREKEDRGSLMAPRMDYDEWTPIGRGDPLKNDPTYDYVPPVLDKVHYWINPSARTSESPQSSESQIVALGATPGPGPAATKKPFYGQSPLKPVSSLNKSEIKRYHLENKYQGIGPYISSSKYPNRGRPQYIPLAHYSSQSTYKYPRPPLTMLVPPPPSQPVTYPSQTTADYIENTNQMTTDLPNRILVDSIAAQHQVPSTTLSLQTGQTSWRTSYPPETTTNNIQEGTNTVYYDPAKREETVVHKQVSPTIDIDATGVQQMSATTVNSSLSSSVQAMSSPYTQSSSVSAQTSTLSQAITTPPAHSTISDQIYSTTLKLSSASTIGLTPPMIQSSRQPVVPFSTQTQASRQPAISVSTQTSRQPIMASSTQTSRLPGPFSIATQASRQPTPASTQTSRPPTPITTQTASSLHLQSLLLRSDATPTTPPSTTNFNPGQTVVNPHPFLAHYKPPQESSKTPMYLIIQGHSKVKKYGAAKLDKISGIPLQDSNEISKESDSSDILKRKARDLGFEDFLPIDTGYFRSTFEDYYDNQDIESSGLNSIPTR